MSEDGSGFSVTYEDDADRYEVATSGRDRARLRWPSARRLDMHRPFTRRPVTRLPSRRVLVPAAVLSVAIAAGVIVGIVRLTSADELPGGFVGAWEGTVVQQSGWPARLDLAGGDVGGVVGTSRYSQQACSGELTLKSVSGRTATVAEHITRQDAAETGCIEDVVITLELTPAGTLRYSGTAGGGFAGTLTRAAKDAPADAFGMVSVAGVHEGDCFSTRPVETPLNRVSCAGPHAAEAVRKIDMSGQDYRQATAARGSGCLFPGELDLGDFDVPLTAVAQVPTRAEWDGGARFAICLVGAQDGATLTGPL